MVYDAHDATLDRRVAVKVLNERHCSRADRARLAREAQTLAKLSHPNVVSVFDVGDDGGQVYLAMELIDGESFAARLHQIAQQPGFARGRYWRDVARLFLGAARGLEAAHHAGIVHRDFKPGNAMVGRDGRVRVVDFGLARTSVAAASVETVDPSELDSADPDVPSTEVDDSASRSSDRLTSTGCVAGTPAYMAPEQHIGAEPAAPTDVYALTVSLYEGLVGQRPFRQRGLLQLARAKKKGPPSLKDLGDRVPRVLVPLLRAGMASRASERPTMPEVVEKLEAALRRPRRLAMGGGAALALSGLLSVPLVFAEPPPCPGHDDPAECVEDERRPEEPDFEPDDGHDKLYTVLARARRLLRDDEVAQSLAMAETVRARAEAIGNERVRASALLLEGIGHRIEGHRQRSEEALSVAYFLAAELQDRETAFRAALELMRVSTDADDLEAGDTWFRHAKSQIPRWGGADEARLARHESELLLRKGRYQAAETRLRDALALVERAPYPDKVLQSMLFAQLVAIVVRQDRGVEALELSDEALALMKDAPRVNPGQRGSLHMARAKALRLLRRWSEAAESLEASRALLAEGYGVSHPSVAQADVLLAGTLRQQGKLAEAEAHVRNAIEIHVQVSGEGGAAANAYQLLAAIRGEQGEREEALEHNRRAMRIFEQTLGDEHPTTGFAHLQVAVTALALRRAEEALEQSDLALAVLEPRVGAHSRDVSVARTRRAQALLMLHRPGEARMQLEQVLRDDAGQDAMDRAWTLYQLARSLWALAERGDADPSLRMRARTLVEDALARIEPHPELEHERDGFRAWLAEHPLEHS